MFTSPITKRISKVLYTFARHLPVSNSKINLGQNKIRRVLAKHIIAFMGENVNIEKKAVFHDSLKIGRNSGIGINCIIGKQVTIGENVMMGPDCIIYTSSHAHDRVDIPMIDQGFQAVKPVRIGDDVWIGTRVIIMPGVTIGDGSIIGAGAIVTHDIPEYCIAAGVPAEVKKNRKRTNE